MNPESSKSRRRGFPKSRATETGLVGAQFAASEVQWMPGPRLVDAGGVLSCREGLLSR